MTSLPSKASLRKDCKKILSRLSDQRKQRAQKEAFLSLFPRLNEFFLILSFASMPTELSTKKINLYLAKKEKLVLPKITQGHLELYKVIDPEKDLICHPHTLLLEPSMAKAIKVDPSEIDFALIPGLAFDRRNHRLGYGKGYYDRLLPLLGCKKVGLGFQEQFLTDLLPINDWDYPLDELALY